MSQSGYDDGSDTPKGIARERRHRQEPTANADTDDTAPEPACWRHNVSDTEWYEPPFTIAYRTIHDPCSDCFPSGPPDASELGTVVRSCSHPTTYHRPRTSADELHGPTETCDEESGTAARREPITTIVELDVGNGVTWAALDSPMVVAETREAATEVTLRGLDGGEYELRERYDSTLLVYPGYGCVNSLARIPAADDNPESA